MVKLDKPVPAIAHKHGNLMLPIELESGERYYQQFFGGNGRVEYAEVLLELLGSPLRGPGGAAQFMLIGNDDELKAMALKTLGEAPVAPPSKPFEGMTVQDSLLTVMSKRPNQYWSVPQLWEGVRIGGYKAKAGNPQQLVKKAMTELQKKGLVERDKQEYRLVPE
jgi:hypothetical protein